MVTLFSQLIFLQLTLVRHLVAGFVAPVPTRFNVDARSCRRTTETSLLLYPDIQQQAKAAHSPLYVATESSTSVDDGPDPEALDPSGSSAATQSTNDDDRTSSCNSSSGDAAIDVADIPSSAFDLTTALHCAGLAFDSYVEPAPDSSRWERGSAGLKVGFVSAAYTRQLYQGLVQVSVKRIQGLPETDDGAAERLLSGDGVDACLLVAVLEGQWKEDVKVLETEQYHTGVLDLSGAAHVSRTSTCWSSVNQKAAEQSQTKNGRALPYHIKGGWGRPATAVWPESEPPFYLYVQDPSQARLVFTVLDDDRLGAGTAIGSTYEKLSTLIPSAKFTPDQLVQQMKQSVLEQLKAGKSSKSDDNAADQLERVDQALQQQLGASKTTWNGKLKLTSKPRKKDKGGQVMGAAVMGAAIAGPLGMAAGAALASVYEGQVQGSVECEIRYLPIPHVPVERKVYQVKGGMPGIDWGNMVSKFQDKQHNKLPHGTDTADSNSTLDATLARPDSISDLEHCFFCTHEKTGATCAVYRSVERRQIVVSFRGTCAPVDLITDASLIQEPWISGDEVENPDIPKVHVGFRTSMNSISRRLKELLLATPAPDQTIAEYDIFITGHSLGGALATLFCADLGQYGIDAGRGLPQLEDSEPWWKGVANVFMNSDVKQSISQEPPRPKSLSLYNFGSPRVGNTAFAQLFDALRDEGFIDKAFRVVNGDDVVARLPRSFNALMFGNINYEHVGTTVLLSQPITDREDNAKPQKPVLWIEGESDDSKCPVRDGVSLSSPMAEGALLNDLLKATRETVVDSDGNVADDVAEKIKGEELSWSERLTSVAGKVTERVKQVRVSDLTSLVGIDSSFTDREVRIIQSLMQGKALAHHLEDEYYAGMGRASGFLARVGEDLEELA